jgi:hypothetical protein
VALEHQEEVVYLGGALRLLEVGASLQVGAAAFRQEVEVVACLQVGVAAYHQVAVAVASLRVVVVYLDLLVAQLQNLR